MRAVLLLAVVPGVAQAELESKGMRAGGAILSISQDRGQGGEAVNPQPGWTAGAFLVWRMSTTFALQLEGAVSNKLLFAEICRSGCTRTSELSFWFFEVPLLARLDLLPGDTKFHIDAGPTLAISLGGGRTDPMTDIYTRFDDLLPFNFGAVLGVGIERGAGPGKITFDVRYQRWFLPLASGDLPADLSNGGSEVRSSHQFSIVGGYAFP